MENTPELKSKTIKDLQEFAKTSPIIILLLDFCDKLLFIDDPNNPIASVLLIDSYIDAEIFDGCFICSRIENEHINFDSAEEMYFDSLYGDSKDYDDYLKTQKTYFIEFVYWNIRNKLKDITNEYETNFD